MSKLGGKNFSEDTDPLSAGEGGGQVDSVVAGTGVTINSSDPVNPVVNVTSTATLTTKGDVQGFSTVEARIPIGTDGFVLTADSAEGLGLKWASVAAASFSGALVTNSGTQTVNSSTSALTWNTEDYDDGGWHDNGVNPSRLTVPSGVTKVRLTGGMKDTSSVTGQFNLLIFKNGVEIYSGGATSEVETAGGDGVSVTSPVLAVVATDFFELFAFATTSRTTDADGRTYFNIVKIA